MAVLGATPVWLDLADSQYVTDSPRDRGPIVDALMTALESIRPGAIVGPLGIRHSDHEAASDACLLLESDSERYCYMDMPYAQTFPEQFDARRVQVGARVSALVPLAVLRPADRDIKRAATSCYATQIPHVRAELSGFDVSMTDPERYWRVTRAHG